MGITDLTIVVFDLAGPAGAPVSTRCLPRCTVVDDEADGGDEARARHRVDRRVLVVSQFDHARVAQKGGDEAIPARRGVTGHAASAIDDHAFLPLAGSLWEPYGPGMTRSWRSGRAMTPRRGTVARMRLGLNIGLYGTAIVDNFALIDMVEDLGYDSVWCAEAYGSDALTPLAWIAARTERLRLGTAVFQIPARTPAMTAMTAATLDVMSNGRFLLGLGVSGPQVVEGWHGRAFGKPLAVTREYVEIVRRILARQDPVEFDGEYYQLPYRGEDATGLGKPLKSMIAPTNPNLPIYLAAIGPRNVSLAAEIADGWLPIFFSPERTTSQYQPLLDAGFARSGDPTKADRFDIAPTVTALVTDDIDAARLQMKPQLALYIGGMGAKGTNFYNDLACRYGYEREAEAIQDLYLEGKRMEATMLVPDALVDEVCLVGPEGAVRDRLDAWKEAGVGTLIVGTSDPRTIRFIAEAVA